MDFVFSTESLLDFVSESLLTSFTFTSDPESVGGELMVAHEVSDVRAGRWLFFTEIPPVHSTVIWLVLLALTLSLNPIVWWHYYGVKSSNRPYVLAFVVLDVGSAVFAMIPGVIKENVVNVEILPIAIFYAPNTWGAVNAAVYLYPSLFLALDRFLAVYFPHKFREMSVKTRVFKIVMVSLSVMNSIGLILSESFLGYTSIVFLISLLIHWFLIALELVLSVVIYAAIVVKIVRSSQKFSGNKHSSRFVQFSLPNRCP